MQIIKYKLTVMWQRPNLRKLQNQRRIECKNTLYYLLNIKKASDALTYTTTQIQANQMNFDSITINWVLLKYYNNSNS